GRSPRPRAAASPRGATGRERRSRRATRRRARPPRTTRRAARAFSNATSLMDTPGVDPAQIAELRRWAQGLESSAASPELRAAARAILLLADEVDRLTAGSAAPERPPELEPPEPPPSDPDDS